MIGTRWAPALEKLDTLLVQGQLAAANNLAMRVATEALAEDASRWRRLLWQSIFQKLDRDYVGQYQSYDFEVCDYELYAAVDGMSLFRGPNPSHAGVAKDNVKGIAILGAAQLFGRFQVAPFHKFVAPQVALPMFNLSLGGAGPDFFLQPKLISFAQSTACCVVLQVLSGRSVGCDEYPGMRMTARAGTNDPATDRIELLSEIWSRDRARCKNLVRRWQKNYVNLMLDLIRTVRMPVVLVWISERSPADWSASHLDHAPDFGAFPQLVDADMVAALRREVLAYIEVSSDAGLPHGFNSRIDGSPCPIFAPKGEPVWSNAYYSSGSAHQELSRKFLKLWPEIRRRIIQVT